MHTHTLYIIMPMLDPPFCITAHESASLSHFIPPLFYVLSYVAFPSVLPVQTPHSPSTTCVWLQRQLIIGMTWDSIMVVWVFPLLCVVRLGPVLPTRQRKRKRRHYFSTTYTMCQWLRGQVLQEHCTTMRRRQHCRLSRPT